MNVLLLLRFRKLFILKFIYIMFIFTCTYYIKSVIMKLNYRNKNVNYESTRQLNVSFNVLKNNKKIEINPDYSHLQYDYSIFFIESNYNRKEFTTKEMCAIESAAKTNPKALIQVYTFTAKLNEKASLLLNLYPNIRIIHFEPEMIFKDTPLLQWWLNRKVLSSSHSFAHIADAFR